MTLTAAAVHHPLRWRGRCATRQTVVMHNDSTRRPLRGARSVAAAGLWCARSAGGWSVPRVAFFMAFCGNPKHPVLIVFQNRWRARARTHATAEYDASVSLICEGQRGSPSFSSRAVVVTQCNQCSSYSDSSAAPNKCCCYVCCCCGWWGLFFGGGKGW